MYTTHSIYCMPLNVHIYTRRYYIKYSNIGGGGSKGRSLIQHLNNDTMYDIFCTFLINPQSLSIFWCLNFNRCMKEIFDELNIRSVNVSFKFKIDIKNLFDANILAKFHWHSKLEITTNSFVSLFICVLSELP